MKEQEIYHQAWEKWGTALQLVMVIEECSELQKEICKILRGDKSEQRMNALSDEIADVRLMCNQLEIMYHLEAEIETSRQAKLERLENLLKGEPCIKQS